MNVIDSHIKSTTNTTPEYPSVREYEVTATADASRYAMIGKNDMRMIGRNYSDLLSRCAVFLGCDATTLRYSIAKVEKKIYWKRHWVLSHVGENSRIE